MEICSTKLIAVHVPEEGNTHCEDAPPTGGPSEEELPEPSSAGARSGYPSKRGHPGLLTSPTNAALISRHKGTAAGRQTTCQADAQGPNHAHGHGKGLGTIAGARNQESCSGTACTFVGVKSDLRKNRALFVCPKHMHPSRRNPTTHTHHYAYSC